jgi:4'-phosphopantetheinyl transferase EntD
VKSIERIPRGETNEFLPYRDQANDFLANLFPGNVTAHDVMLADQYFPLYAEEAGAIVRSVPSRRIEFSAGRFCARMAMRRLGYPAAVVPAGADRAPVWPLGLVGSISHCRGYCAAVLAQCKHFRSIGLDVEQRGAVSPSLESSILRSEEIEMLRALAQADSMDWLTLYFSAKEATYKALYPLHRKLIGFHEVRICLDREKGTFIGDILADLPASLACPLRINGRYLADACRIYTGAWVA